MIANLIEHIDRLNRLIGRAAAWLVLAVVALAFAVVVLRYAFGWGRIWLQESYVWLHAVAFMLGAAFTLSDDGHVRIDLIYAHRGPRFRALIDLAGSILLLMPFVATVLYTAIPYWRQSWATGEGSREAGGLAGVYLLKGVIFVFAVMMLLQGMVLAVRSFEALRGRSGPGQRARQDLPL
jgi:TRAP-type mannitol/chloroaromatic compound transport system permease small subunit